VKWRPINEAIPPRIDEEQCYVGKDKWGNFAFIRYYGGAKQWRSSVFDEAGWIWFVDLNED